MKESVGILIVARDTNNFMLLHRTKKPIVWSVLSGKMEKSDKNPLTCIKREINEEINLDVNILEIIKLGTTIIDDKKFHLFIGYVNNEFKPILKLDENDDYGWFNEDTIPSPMHKRWDKTFQLIKPMLYLKENIKNNINNLLNNG